MKYLACIKFDGTDFYGTNIQPNKRTICGYIEETLTKIFNTKTKITPCSRLDKGVHAINFYFTFESCKNNDLEKLKKSLNSLLKDEIYIKNITEVDENFHARYDVENKEYVYIIETGEYNPIERNHILMYNKPIDIELIKKASEYLKGTHNFKSFTSDDEKENYIRRVNYIKIEKEKTKIYIYINADGFLKYMIRNIIGLFLEINEGKKQINDIPTIIEKEDRRVLGIKALPNGLYLNKVNYKNKYKK